MTRFIFWKVLLVAITVFGLLALSGVLFAQGRSDFGLERAKEVQEAHTPELMAINGVVGTAVGLNQENHAVVKVFTARAGVAGIPGRLDGVTVQPVVSGEFYALKPPADKPDKPGKPGGGGGGSLSPTDRWPRPVPIGVSTGHPNITAGTIGCRVKDSIGNVYALSNNHVYADENKASIGDNVLQPGAYDGGSSHADGIGTLYGYISIDFNGGNNTVDAAIASTTTDLLGTATPPDGYGTPKSTTVEASINQSVKKYGRTTGLTKGKVYATNATVSVGYDSGAALFVHQIIITPGGFSSGGDSGSLIVVNDSRGKNKGPDDCKAVGLLFAGSSSFTVANPIDDVLDAFKVSIDGE
jgi:hypothetical protein